MTRTLTVCNGKICRLGYCEKCGKKAMTTSCSICGHLVPYEPGIPHPEREPPKGVNLEVPKSYV